MAGFEGTGAIETYSGRAFDPLDPNPSTIRVEDVAHGLAHTCRFDGQCQFYYAVATHAIYLKREVDAYDRIERDVLAAVWDRLCIRHPNDEQWQAVMDADDREL